MGFSFYRREKCRFVATLQRKHYLSKLGETSEEENKTLTNLTIQIDPLNEMSKENKDTMLKLGNPGWSQDVEKIIKDLKIRKGVWITKGQMVATVSETTDSKSSKLFRIKASLGGKVTEIFLKSGDKVDETSVLCTLTSECSHSTLMKDMCADCGADLRQDEFLTSKVNKKQATVAMVHSIPELKVSSKEAETLGKEDELRLRKNKKLVLLVDLDQTLIHTTNDNVKPNMKDVHHFQLYGPHSPWYHTRIRPYTFQFLERISKLYELHICTFGARLYAHTIAKFLDPKSKYFSHRILSRDECFDNRSKTANLSALFPVGDHMVCIIDDREDVWKFAPNLVHVKPYNFFENTGDINAPPGSSNRSMDKKGKANTSEETLTKDADDTAVDNVTDDQEEKEIDTKDLELSDDDDDSTGDEKPGESEEKNDEEVKDESKKAEKDKVSETEAVELVEVEDADDYLLYLEDILTTIHKAFYDLNQQMSEQGKSEVPDLKNVIPYVKRKVLQGTNIVFSGVVPTHRPLRKSRPFSVAKSLGASVTEGLVKEGKEKTTHLIAARLGTAKVNEAKKMNDLHIVTPNWLWSCAERWERIEERLFPLGKQVPILLKPPAHCSSPEITFAERCEEFELSKAKESKLPEVMNPMLAFSSEDLKGMDKEIDDLISGEDSNTSSSSSNSGNTLTPELKATSDKEFPPKVDEADSSSSEESLDAAEPRGWSKRRKIEEQDSESDMDEDGEEEGQYGDDINDMAAELEREFMKESNLN